MAVSAAVANPKGGVGKSTTALMVSEGLALNGRRVLVFDLDPQAYLSRVLIGPEGVEEADKQKRTLAHMLQDFASGISIQPATYRTPASDLVELRDASDGRCVDLVSSNPKLLTELEPLENEIRQRYPEDNLDVTLAKLLSGVLERLEPNYDVILFDCPAMTGPLAMAAIRLSSHVITPTNLEENSFWTLNQFVRGVVRNLGLAKNPSLHVVFTLHVASNTAQNQLLDQIRNDVKGLSAIHRPVPHTTAIQRAEYHPGPGNYRRAKEKYSTALREVHALANAIAERILEGNRQ